MLAYDDGKVFLSTDAKAEWPTWNEIPAAMNPGGTIEDIYFDIYDSSLWICGAGGYVLRSTDKANNWVAWDAWQIDASATFKKITVDSNTVFVVGAPVKSYIAHDAYTANPTFTAVEIDPTLGQLRAVSGSPTDANETYVVGENGIIIYTKDASTFTYVADNSITDLYNDVLLVDPDTIYVVSEEGNLVYSTDSAASWTSVATGVVSLNSIAKAGSKLVAVADTGKIVISTDYGTSWNPAISGTTEDLTDVWMVGEDTIYVTGTNSTFLRSFDGGTSFVYPLELNPTSFVDVELTSGENHVWLVDTNAMLLVQEAGSSTFTFINDQDYKPFGFSVEARGAGYMDDKVLIWGMDSDTTWALYRRQNGNDWDQMALPADFGKKAINDAFSVDRDYGYAVADNATLLWYRDIDDGNGSDAGAVDLKEIRLDTTGAAVPADIKLINVWADHRDRVTIVADSGYIIKTDDRCVTWSAIQNQVIANALLTDANNNLDPLFFIGEDGFLAYPALTLEVNDTGTPVVCVGDMISVDYTVSNQSFDGGNEFILQISDETGSFASATNLDTVAGTGSGSFTDVTLPGSLSTGTAYKLRVIATSPATSADGMYTVDITNASPVASFTWVESSIGVVDFTNTSTDASLYDWDFGDGSGTSTATNPQYDYGTGGGTWNIILTASEGACWDSTHVQVTTTVSIIETEAESDIVVYPNPSNGIIYLSGIEKAIAEIINESGQVVMITEINSSIDLSSLPKGMYQIRLVSDEQVEVISVIVK
jgi:photosystem II stability/assembly factor-like uncharacterized protein/PKD repeat protein